MVSPSPVVRRGKVRLQYAINTCVQILRANGPVGKFDQITRSSIVEIADGSERLERDWGAILMRGTNPARKQERSERRLRHRQAIDQSGDHVRVFSVNRVFLFEVDDDVRARRWPKPQDYGIVKENYNVYKNGRHEGRRHGHHRVNE
jgi:hypothetical protein